MVNNAKKPEDVTLKMENYSIFRVKEYAYNSFFVSSESPGSLYDIVDVIPSPWNIARF